MAKKGYVTSGNLVGSMRYDKAIYHAVLKRRADHYLFSHEGIIDDILSDPPSLQNLAKEFTLELVLYCRNPLDHAFSTYGQGVKRAGYTMSMAEWIDYYNRPQRVVDMIDLCESYGVTLKLINYSKIESVEKSFCEALFGSKSDDFLNKAQFTKTKVINRSLSRVEYEIQREFNKHFGARSSRFVSDALVNKAPDIKPELEYIEIDHLKTFVHKHQESVRYINYYLDKSKKLELEIPEDIKPKANNYVISSKQIAILAESIYQQMVKSKASVLENRDADYLRDIALKFENKKTLTLEDAHYLMGLAHKARPSGPVIKKKLESYESKLKIMP